MRLLRGYGPILGVWLLAVAAVVGITVHGQAQERDRLFERFQLRSDTGASFVGAYVQDVFKTEKRLGAEVTAPSWRPSEFTASANLLGFPAGVLLDREGRAVALAPRAPKMEGTQLASEPLSPPDGRARRSAHRLRHRALGGGGQADRGVRPPAADRALRRAVDGVQPGGRSVAGIPGTTTDRRHPWLHHGLLRSDDRLCGRWRRRSAAGKSRSTSALDHPTVVDGRLLAATRIPGTPWTYMLDAPEDALLAPMTSHDRSQWGLLATLGAAEPRRAARRAGAPWLLADRPVPRRLGWTTDSG